MPLSSWKEMCVVPHSNHAARQVAWTRAELIVSVGPRPPPPPPRAHGAPRSAVLLWQTSLGGTVRQCLCPCQGKEYRLSPPWQFLALVVQLCRFSKDAVANGSSSSAALRHPFSHYTLGKKQHLLIEEMKPGALKKFSKAILLFSTFTNVGVECYIYKSSNTK